MKNYLKIVLSVFYVLMLLLPPAMGLIWISMLFTNIFIAIVVILAYVSLYAPLIGFGMIELKKRLEQ